jgi:hypothetical protein
MDGAPFMPDRQITTRDLREHSRNGATVSNSEFVNSLLGQEWSNIIGHQSERILHPVTH